VINNLTDTDFDPSDFDHHAFYNNEEKRIEMHLRAGKDMTIKSSSGSYQISIKKDETIHIENSYKFDREDIKAIGSMAGLDVEKVFTDNREWFSLVHYKKR